MTGLGKECCLAFLYPFFPHSSQCFAERTLRLVPAGKSPQAEELPKNSESVALKVFLKETLAFSFCSVRLACGEKVPFSAFFISHCKCRFLSSDVSSVISMVLSGRGSLNAAQQ